MQPVDSPVYSSSKPWGWAWFGWSVLVALSVAFSLIAAFFISFGDSTTCNELPTAANLAAGQRHLAYAAGLLACVWAIVTFFSPSRWPRVLLGYSLGALPLLAMSLTHVHAHDWTGGFCF